LRNHTMKETFGLITEKKEIIFFYACVKLENIEEIIIQNNVILV